MIQKSLVEKSVSLLQNVLLSAQNIPVLIRYCCECERELSTQQPDEVSGADGNIMRVCVPLERPQPNSCLFCALRVLSRLISTGWERSCHDIRGTEFRIQSVGFYTSYSLEWISILESPVVRIFQTKRLDLLYFLNAERV